jgi:hypothetical protein
MEIKPFGDGARVTKSDKMNLSEMVSESAARRMSAVALEVQCNEDEDIRYGIEYNLAHHCMAVHTFPRFP